MDNGTSKMEKNDETNGGLGVIVSSMTTVTDNDIIMTRIVSPPKMRMRGSIFFFAVVPFFVLQRVIPDKGSVLHDRGAVFVIFVPTTLS